mgnify:CR=1 FL=1
MDTDLDKQAISDMASGYADEPTETPVQPQTEVIAEVEETPAPKYVQITEEQFQRLESGVAEVEKIRATQEKSFGTAFGKIGGLERILNDIQSRTSSGETPQVDAADFQEMVDEYPDVAKLQVAGLNRVLAKLKGTGGSSIDPAKLEAMVQERLAEKLQPAIEEAFTVKHRVDEDKKVLKVHADKAEIYRDPKFLEFVNKRADKVEVLAAWDADVLIPVLNDYKTSLKPKAKAIPAVDPKAIRKQILDAGITPRGSGASSPSRNEVDDFHAGYQDG